MRTIGMRSVLSISFGVGGAILILVAWEVFTAGVSSENAIMTVNRGLVPADVLWIIWIPCFATAILVYGMTPYTASDELTGD